MNTEVDVFEESCKPEKRESTKELGTYTVEDIKAILGIGRDAAYSLIRSNVFRSVKVGRSILIVKRSFDEWFYGTAI